MQANRLPRGAAGVAYGNPIHLLDAAQYIRLAWDSISDATIKNAYNFTTQLVPLRNAVGEKFDLYCVALKHWLIDASLFSYHEKATVRYA